MTKCPMCGGNEWEKGKIDAGELFENFTFSSKSTIGRIHGMVCMNCGFVLTFIGQNNLPDKKK